MLREWNVPFWNIQETLCKRFLDCFEIPIHSTSSYAMVHYHSVQKNHHKWNDIAA